ncbi:MAG: hypothetical protein WDN76_06815 [Alphaproteobacteria bacterium]
MLSLAEIAVEHHLVADEAERIGRYDADLAQLARDFEAGDQRSRRGFPAAHNFQQTHHMRRREEVQADNLRRPVGFGGELTHRKRRRVGREDRVRRRSLIQFADDLLLQVHILETPASITTSASFAPAIDVAPEMRLCAVHTSAGVSARASTRRLVIAAHHTKASIKRGLVHINQHRRHAGIRQGHRNSPPPIVPAPTTAALLIAPGCMGGRPGILQTSRSAKRCAAAPDLRDLSTTRARSGLPFSALAQMAPRLKRATLPSSVLRGAPLQGAGLCFMNAATSSSLKPDVSTVNSPVRRG